jgi:hypothetical protein
MKHSLPKRIRTFVSIAVSVFACIAAGIATTVMSARWEALDRTLHPDPHLHRRWIGDGILYPIEGWQVAVAELKDSGVYRVDSVRVERDSIDYRDAGPRAAAIGDLPQWSRAAYPPSNDARCDVYLSEHAYGWPARSMVVEVMHDGANARVVSGVVVQSKPNSPWELIAELTRPPWTSAGFMDPSASAVADPTVRQSNRGAERVLPLRVIPSGFMMNTVSFGVAWWILLNGVRWAWGVERQGIRSRIEGLRARRGACRACGHPLAGLARCPECGAVVK